jgi:hypothetical protein
MAGSSIEFSTSVEKYVENGPSAGDGPPKRLKILASRQAKAPGGHENQPFAVAGGHKTRRLGP